MDEMDLMKKLSDVPSPSPEAYDRARTALQTAMAEPENTVVRPKRWFSWPRASVAAVGAAAVAVAVVMGTTGGSVPPGPTTQTQAAQPVIESPLVKLASDVKAGAALPGDSSLVISTKMPADLPSYTAYTVYTDKGQIFTGDSVKSLSNSVTRNEDQAQPFNAKVMAAAREAAKGDVEKARIAMITAAHNVTGIGLSDAEAEKVWTDTQAKIAEDFRKFGKPFTPKPRPTGKELENFRNNHLWSNATSALFVGAANPEVRAGVLKLMATIKEAAVGETEIDGQRALTISTGPEIQGGDASAVLTINADNGLPIREDISPAKNSPHPSKPSMVTYKSSRVTLADVAAGKI